MAIIKGQWIKSIGIVNHKVIFSFTGNKKIVRAMPKAMAIMMVVMKEFGNSMSFWSELKMIVNTNGKNRSINFIYNKKPARVLRLDRSIIRVRRIKTKNC
jgi:hypothetical protein